MINHSFLFSMKKRIFIVSSIIFAVLFLLFFGIKILDLINYKCIFRELFGFYCAGCGTTRMLKSIFEFEFYKAFRYNSFLFILLIIGLIYIFYLIIYYIKEGKLKLPSLKVILIIIAMLFLYSILRNIPCFYFLRPQ